ncbi:hypothetical protein [Rufibacter sp. LB8]|uniref:hypothetical protein n=1 Tax=Rufibacter sp. LB8 TaxID=2777781 RepID=UPI00178C77C8|nr:hypothetical protein [Rufibacter sp. LB8]
MSVSRSIKIRVVTNHKTLSDLIRDFTNDFWTLKDQNGKFSSIAVNDLDDFDYKVFYDVEEVYKILDNRERSNKLNAITFCDREYFECNILLIYPLENKNSGYAKHYELHITPGIGKRIIGSDRYTDYGYYLNNTLPKLKEIGCYVCEVECQDFDS